jgi:hypothetical protein
MRRKGIVELVHHRLINNIVEKMARLRLVLLHSLNPLHVYCRLVSLGVNEKVGMTLSRYYEKSIYKVVKLVVW